MIVAVTGAAGTVGDFVVRGLRSTGFSVRANVRQPTPWLDADGSVSVHIGDLKQAPHRRKLLDGAGALVHCAFSHVPGRYRGGEGDDPVQFWRDNVVGTVELLEDARVLGVERIVLLSSRAAVSNRHFLSSTVCPDASVPAPDGHYGAIKAAMEALALACSTATTSICTLRPTGVYGVRTQVQKSKWIDLVRGVIRHEGEPTPRVATEVHGDDVAAAVALLLRASAADVAGRTFNCSDLVVSRAVLTRFCRQAVRDPSHRLARSVDASEPFPNLILGCDGLRELGWRPGGVARLEHTLRTLIRHELEA